MYLKNEIIISIFIINISASNLSMPMIWLYVFLLDFLIPFLYDPGLQCRGPDLIGILAKGEMLRSMIFTVMESWKGLATLAVAA